MANPSYLTLKDENGKLMRGSVVITGREGQVEVWEHHHEVRIPTDKDTGILTGTRKHEAFTIIKPVDKSSVYLYQACCKGSTLQSVSHDMYRHNATSGDEEKLITQTLEGVKVVSVKAIIHQVKVPDMEHFVPLEEVSFRYGKITWMYHDGNIAFSDSWDSRGQ